MSVNSPIYLDMTVAADSAALPMKVAAAISYETGAEFEGPYEYAPSETAQTIPIDGKTATEDIVLDAVPSDYVGSAIDRRSGSDLTASGATVTAPAGYYAAAASKAVASGTEGTPSASKGAVSNHSVAVTPAVTNVAGYIQGGTKTGTPVTVTAAELASGTKEITANGTGIDVTGYAAVDVAVPAPAPSLQTKSVSFTPSESAQSQTVTADAGFDGLDEVGVSVAAVPSDYVGSAVDRRDSTDLAASGATVTAPAGYYAAAASKAVASGTEGTPSASKGAVSNHSVAVTPSVTNTEGYIAGGTKTGTPVTVTAAELESGTKEITANGTGIDVTGYAAVDVAVPGSSVEVEALSVTQNGTYTASAGKAYSPVTVSVSGGVTPAPEKDVNFIDYDGTILYSYTAAEFASLSALPSNPTHDGLTAQGWNWSLAGAKTYVAANKKLWIGQKYKPSDGKTKLYCTFSAGMLSPYLCFPVNGTVKINWGDGSAEDTVTGTSGTSVKSTQHTYAAPGRYVISIEVVSGYFSFYGSSNMSYLLRKVLNTTLNSNRVALACLDRVVFGDNARTGQYAFFHCENLRNVVLGAGVNISSNAFQSCLMLESLTIPATCTLSGSVFRSCYGLRNISFPEGFSFSSGYTYCFSGCTGLTTVSLPGSTVAGYTFSSCSNLREVIIPSGADKIDANTFQADASVAALTIPASVTTIGASAFSNVYGLYEIHFKGATPPTAGSNAFQNLPTACIIYVPTGKVSAYQGEANYPSSSTYTYVEE